MGGTKADQEELQTFKSIEHSEKPCLALHLDVLGMFCSRCELCSNQERSVEHVQARQCQNY